jgi:hypothetical protein
LILRAEGSSIDSCALAFGIGSRLAVPGAREDCAQTRCDHRD